MKRICGFLLTLVLVLGLAACAKAPTWQEQYDLGVKYLSEGNYQEAIIAFTAAIEIDPKRAEAYVGRGDAYVGTVDLSAAAAELPEESRGACESALADYLEAIGLDNLLAAVYGKAADIYLALGDEDSAIAILEQGYEATGDISLRERLKELKDDGSLTVLIRQTSYEADGTPERMEQYSYDERGYMVFIETFRCWPDGTFDKENEQEVQGYPPGTVSRFWTGTFGGERSVITNPYPWYIGRSYSSSDMVTWMENPPERVDNPNPGEEAWSYAIYTYNEDGYAIHIATYGPQGELMGTAELEWETIIPVSN